MVVHDGEIQGRETVRSGDVENRGLVRVQEVADFWQSPRRMAMKRSESGAATWGKESVAYARGVEDTRRATPVPLMSHLGPQYTRGQLGVCL